MNMRSYIAVIAVLISGLAFAGPNYDFVELTYGTGDLDIGISGLGSADIDQDGFKIEGNVAATENILVRGSFSALSGDEAGVDLDIDTIVLGAGWIFPVNDDTGIDVGLEYRTDDLKVSDGIDSVSDDIDGVGLAAGITSAVGENINLSARLSYLESDYEGAFVIDLSGTYFVSDNVGITLGVERLDADDDGVDLELTQIQLGARMRF